VLFAGISIVALSAMPVHLCQPAELAQHYCSRGAYTTQLATRYLNDPVAGIARALPHPLKDILLPMVAILASSILLIAANAGVLGASRLAFSMGSYQQVPEILHSVNRQTKTPIISIVFFSMMAILLVLSGELTHLTAVYIFGATLGFTMAHASLIGMRLREAPDAKHDFRLWLNIPFRGKEIPITAVIGGLGTLAVWILVALFDPFGRYAGFAWMIGGIIIYVAYRRKKGLSLTESAERKFEMR
jgi:APA family basic amino acid/polyamine antiporter